MKNLLERSDTERKNTPILDGVVGFFPNGLTAAADNSMLGQVQHNAGKPFDWDRTKSQDELGSLQRHILDFILAEKEGNYEEMARATKAMAWRGLAHAERFFGTTVNDPKRYQDAKILRDGIDLGPLYRCVDDEHYEGLEYGVLYYLQDEPPSKTSSLLYVKAINAFTGKVRAQGCSPSRFEKCS